ncbi:hypothetical protein D9M68_855020 [compost metagenome]
MQHAVGTEAYPVGTLVGLEMQVRRAAAYGIQKHLVDEAHHGGVVSIYPAWPIMLIVIDCFNVHAIQVDVPKIFHAAICALEELLDGIAQLVILDQDGFGVQAGAELNIGYSLMVGGVGDADE